jgi:hypothetical protein
MSDLLEEVKSQSKSVGTHERRELYWHAYSKLVKLSASALDEQVSGFLAFHLADEDGNDPANGTVSYLPATKRQRGLLGSITIMGKKFKSIDPDSDPSQWIMAWFDDDAQRAYDDIMDGEPVVYLSQDMDGVFIGTLLKRRKCRSAPSSALKKPEDVDAFKETLLPDNPLQSLSWVRNDPVELNAYNFILAGKVAKTITDKNIYPHVASASTNEIYACFEAQRNMHFLSEAERLIAMMLTDIAKGEANPICNVTVKLAGIARKNGLLKTLYVDSSKQKLINAVKEDASGVEMYVIQGAESSHPFMEYGGAVFELHYRADLSIFDF